MSQLAEPVFEQHSQLYFEDGDVILAAEIPSRATGQPSHETDPSAAPPPTHRLFRVHKTILAIHSSVFANMFKDASPMQTEVHDGVPLITMVGDDADPFARLLQLVYQLPYASGRTNLLAY